MSVHVGVRESSPTRLESWGLRLEAGEVVGLAVYLNDFEGQRLLRRSAPRNDIGLCHCERSKAISAESQLQETIKSNEMKY